MTRPERFFTRSDIERGLRRLGELAAEQGLQLHVQVMGGCAMMLRYETRA